jgi:hypothetical protein
MKHQHCTEALTGRLKVSHRDLEQLQWAELFVMDAAKDGNDVKIKVYL